jgi:uncharacterized protein
MGGRSGRSPRVAITRNGDRVCQHCLVVQSLGRRLKGLLGRRALSQDEGLMLEPAAAVHTWFMRFPIDVVFLDGDGRILRVVDSLGPWRLVARRGAKSALQLPAGAIARCDLQVGDVLRTA